MRPKIWRLLVAIIHALFGPAGNRHVQISWFRGPERPELNILVRRPFYMNWRFGKVQNALWIGFRRNSIGYEFYNWFPTPMSDGSLTFGRWSRRTIQNQLRQINIRHAIEDDPSLRPLYEANGDVKPVGPPVKPEPGE